MPLYDYQCASCKHIVEVRHGFNDTYNDACPVCGGKMNRVFNPAPIVFKGSGFYINDSRPAPSSESKTAAAPAATPATPAAAPAPAKSSSDKGSAA